MDEFYEQALIEKTKAILGAFDQYLRTHLGGADTASRQNKAKDVLEEIGQLQGVVPPDRHPQWLKQLWSMMSSIATVQNDLTQFVKAAIHWAKEAEQHKWSDEYVFDFDAVFEKYRDECRLPELFDEILKCFGRSQSAREMASTASHCSGKSVQSSQALRPQSTDRTLRRSEHGDTSCSLALPLRR